MGAVTLGAIPSMSAGEQVEVERPAAGRPHAGKVLAAVQAHADDVPLFCGGTVAKLISEGYTDYLIQTTNNDKCGPIPTAHAVRL